MLYYEQKLKKQGYKLIIGVDEVGRGPLAGPVVAAAALLRTNRFKNRIDDSKKLSPKLREKAFFEILGKSDFGIGIEDEKVIDAINIAQATRSAMKKAVHYLVNRLGSKGHKGIYIIVDGNIRLDVDFPCTAIIKGDSKSKTIASASILAKVIRDRMMRSYDKIYPQYGFLDHKGYGTKKHRDVLKKIGPSPIHRKSFSYV